MNPRTRTNPAHCFAFVAIAAVALTGCGRETTPAPAPPATPPGTAAMRPATAYANAISLRIDDREWHADRAIEVLVHPPGFDRMLMVSGSFGPKDRDEQAFNLNLVGVDRPGRYEIKGGSVTGNAIQLANLDAAHYLVGGALGADIVVEVTTLQRAPVVVEGRFSGTMNANDGARARIENGRFSYRE